MVIAYIRHISTANVLVQSASKLATQLVKEFGLLSFVDSDELILGRENELKGLLDESMDVKIIVRNLNPSALSEVC